MPEPTGPIRLKRIEDARVTVPIVGVTPLIVQRWSEKALQAIRDKQMQQDAPKAREPKNPKEAADAATYWLEDGQPGMPAVAFKAAMVDACRYFDNLAMTDVRRMLFVEGDGVDQLVPILGEKTMREDTPRVGMGKPDLRYRYAFWPWSADITVRYPPTRLSAESVVALLDAGGRGGVGEWRPSSPRSNTGTYGQFRVREA